MNYTNQDTEGLTSTARSWSAITGRVPVVYRTMIEAKMDGDRILDLGAGTGDGFLWVLNRLDNGRELTACDLRPRREDILTVAEAGKHMYDLILLSNVLNVQYKETQVLRVLAWCLDHLRKDGRILFNYPLSPRRNPYLNEERLLELVNGTGFTVRSMGRKVWIGQV